MHVLQEDLSRCLDLTAAAASGGADSNSYLVQGSLSNSNLGPVDVSGKWKGSRKWKNSSLVQGALLNSNLVLVDVSRRWKCGEGPHNEIFTNPK